MSYDHEDFAKLHYKKFKLRAKVTAALLERPNWGFEVEELNEKLGREPSDIAIEGVRGVLRDLEELIEIGSRQNPRGPPTKIYKPGELLDSYRDPILPTIFGKGREEIRDIRTLAAIACANYTKDPMQCTDPSCKICAANGKKTCWDQVED